MSIFRLAVKFQRYVKSNYLTHKPVLDKQFTSQFQENITKPGNKPEKTEADDFIDQLHKAYLGLMWYMEWKSCKVSQEEWESQMQTGGGLHDFKTTIYNHAEVLKWTDPAFSFGNKQQAIIVDYFAAVFWQVCLLAIFQFVAFSMLVILT